MTIADHTQPCIVAGFDNTPSGFDAVALGRQLAVATHARLIVAHVYPLNGIGTTDVALDAGIGEKMRAAALETVEHAGFVLEGFDAWGTTAYAAMPPARGLHEVAERHGAQMIVVGSTHRHGLGRVVPGATAERLLHGSGFPIVVAPAGWRGATIRAIGVGFDGSQESRNALDAATALASASGASLRVVSAFEAPNPANPAFAVTSHGYTEIMGELRAGRRRVLEEAVEDLPAQLPCTVELRDGRPADVLATESGRLDLLVIGSRGYGALRATLASTVAHRLASDSRCPLLLVPRGLEQPLRGLERHSRTECGPRASSRAGVPVSVQPAGRHP